MSNSGSGSDGPRVPLGEWPVGVGLDLTYTEVHATILGVCVGAVTAFASVLGFDQVAVALAALFVGTTLGFGLHERLTHGDRVLRREPWYALGGLVLAGALVFGARFVLTGRLPFPS